MLRKAAREAGVVLLYLALAIAMTWPLVAHLSTALPDLGDPLVNMWIVDWVSHALTHEPWNLYDSPLYYPGRLTLAYSENLIGVALFVLPFHLAGAHPIAVYNIALLLGFAWSGYGAFVLARVVTRSTAASLVAGVVFAFVPFKWDHLSHMQLQWSGWIPLLLAAVIVYWRTPSTRTALLLTGAFVMNGLTNVHYFLFGSFTAVIAVIVLAIANERRDRRFWLRLAAAFVIGGLVLLPFLLPYRIISKELGAVRTEGDAISGSAPLKAWLGATPRSIWYGRLGGDELHRHEFQLFPGLAAIFLALIGAVKTARVQVELPTRPARRAPFLDALIIVLGILTYIGAVTERTELAIGPLRLLALDSAETVATLLLIALVVRYRETLRDAIARSRFDAAAWIAAVAIAVGVIGSLGMSAFMHAFLFRYFSVFHAIRAPVRWAIIAYAGLAVWAAIGAKTLIRGRATAALLLAVVALDLWPRLRYEHAVPNTAPVYRWLARERVAPLIELPTSEGGINTRYLLGSAVHRLAQLNGVENMGVPDLRRIRIKGDAHEYDDELLALLERNQARLLVVHAHAFNAAGRAWLSRELQRGRLAFVRSFDHDVGGDFVFALTKNLRDWQRLRGPEAPDGAGHLPEQKLARMLRGESVHSDAILAHVETPGYRETVNGTLRVRGWTLSPFPIKRVTVRIHGGRLQLDVPLVERPDVKAVYPWYYFVPRPGFDVFIAKRPDNIPRETELQVEVEDAEGRVMRTADVLIDWD
ncbi:MAG TPA: hypothetical protein VE974_14745 [Thermoanaerobaculia bacterium]|nr:hypothetical protein [Thermoanaerobaculia bacterium]